MYLFIYSTHVISFIHWSLTNFVTGFPESRPKSSCVYYFERNKRSISWLAENMNDVQFNSGHRVGPGRARRGKVLCAEGICQSSSCPAASLSLLSAAIKVNHLFQLVFATAIILCVQYEIRNYVALVMVLSSPLSLSVPSSCLSFGLCFCLC